MPGMRGVGFYAWRKSAMWRELAQGWYRYRNAAKRFQRDLNPLGVVVYVVAETTEDRYLDITDQELVDEVSDLAKISSIDINDPESIGAVYERYITGLEVQAGVEFDVLETTVAPPPPEHCPEYSVRLQSSPRCYIMRRSDCLRIVDTEEFVL